MLNFIGEPLRPHGGRPLNPSTLAGWETGYTQTFVPTPEALRPYRELWVDGIMVARSKNQSMLHSMARQYGCTSFLLDSMDQDPGYMGRIRTLTVADLIS